MVRGGRQESKEFWWPLGSTSTIRSTIRVENPKKTGALSQLRGLSQLDLQGLFQLLEFPLKSFHLLGHIQSGLHFGKTVR